MTGQRRNMRERVGTWWNGRFIPAENDPGDSLIVFGGITHRHWTSRAARAVVGFVAREWKWVIGTTLAVIGLTMTYVRLF
ncbi:hypothetical protein [Roseovarius sp. THAF8]|uniref:hypothetical protein n=1 Tax=Roseovarius sp. THAF8 TaxID=2587846 RepID=UPI001561B056|nr:hypothetical protein [Roseovarius sp. THAF8]